MATSAKKRATFTPAQKTAAARRSVASLENLGKSAQAPAKDEPEADGEAKPRARVTVDPGALLGRALTGAKEQPDVSGDLVSVNVPRAFRLTDDGHAQHDYGIGRQRMPRAHAEHFYAVANGVTAAED